MDDFFRAMAPYLAANLLTVAFVYSMMQWSKADQEDREPKTLALGVVVMVGAFLLYGMYLHGGFDAFR